MKTINVVAAVFRKNGQIFAAKRKSDKFNNMWEFPGGKVETGETSHSALEREIKEELGIDIKIKKEIGKTSFSPENHCLIEITFIECEPNFENFSLKNHYEFKWIRRSDEVSPWAPGDLPILKKIFK